VAAAQAHAFARKRSLVDATVPPVDSARRLLIRMREIWIGHALRGAARRRHGALTERRVAALVVTAPKNMRANRVVWIRMRPHRQRYHFDAQDNCGLVAGNDKRRQNSTVPAIFGSLDPENKPAKCTVHCRRCLNRRAARSSDARFSSAKRTGSSGGV
jgi:hypothetical protein